MKFSTTTILLIAHAPIPDRQSLPNWVKSMLVLSPSYATMYLTLWTLLLLWWKNLRPSLAVFVGNDFSEANAPVEVGVFEKSFALF